MRNDLVVKKMIWLLMPVSLMGVSLVNWQIRLARTLNRIIPRSSGDKYNMIMQTISELRDR